jgi:hypothetical protein
VRIRRDRRLELICKYGEERYTGERYCAHYPERAIDAVAERLADLGISARDLHGCFFSWNYAELGAQLMGR